MVELPSYGMLYESCYNFIQVNGCTGKMGKAITTAIDSARISVAPISFGSEEENGKNAEVCGKDIEVHGHYGRESILSTLFDGRPNLIVVDYTVPTAINGMENRIFFNILFICSKRSFELQWDFWSNRTCELLKYMALEITLILGMSKECYISTPIFLTLL